ncbi:cytosine deaminase [Cucumibacter marinus]|uniref:cytosine deaminase n=1 Tax=Cucumibacter marinus TaxID=1121252 RepID=UPI00041E81C2|nr:cytosine deaminase [Cucumibacter marinus]
MPGLVEYIEANASGFRLCRARIPADMLSVPVGTPVAADGMTLVDLCVAGGRITTVEPAGSGPEQGYDLAGGMILPVFADMHTHLDKTHIARRTANPECSLLGAVKATAADHGNWSEEDLYHRADFALRCAHAHGTAFMRTHLDVLGPQGQAVWQVMSSLRQEWKGRIDLQFVAMAPIGFYLEEGAEAFVKEAARHGAFLGGVTVLRNVPATEKDKALAEALNALFEHARVHDLDIDLHVDESLDRYANALFSVAESTLRHGWHGRVTCGHCCSLSQMEDVRREAILSRCADAGISIVSLPLVNAWLQDRQAHRTPARRGVAPLAEARARGIAVGLASDNCGDAFHPFGDYDLLEVLREATRMAHLPGDTGEWLQNVTTVPARLMGADTRLKVGDAADFLMYSARGMEELLARPQHDRVVIRNGRPQAQPLPSFAELDRLFTCHTSERLGLQ